MFTYTAVASHKSTHPPDDEGKSCAHECGVRDKNSGRGDTRVGGVCESDGRTFERKNARETNAMWRRTLTGGGGGQFTGNPRGAAAAAAKTLYPAGHTMTLLLNNRYVVRSSARATKRRPLGCFLLTCARTCTRIRLRRKS